MPKDYKHRIQGKNTLNVQDFDTVKNISVWRWMLITVIAILAVVLLVYLFTKKPKPTTTSQTVESSAIRKTELEEPEVKAVQFDFYTILPEKEIIVPDYEVKTRTLEEQTGKNGKGKQYLIQAGSYKGLKEAEVMLNKLANMGIEAKVQKAKVGNAIWYRIKLGPFAQISSVNSIHARLKQNGIDAVITETDK